MWGRCSDYAQDEPFGYARGKPLLHPSPFRCHGEPFDCAHSHRSGIGSGDGGRAEWSVGRCGDLARRYCILHLRNSRSTLARRKSVWKDLHAVDICLS